MARNIFIPMLCAATLVWSGLSMADEYRPDEFLSLDLSQAVLSPKPLGPASGFVPGPLDMTVNPESGQARAEPTDQAKVAVHGSRVVVQRTRVAHMRAAPASRVVPMKLARQHRNPVDAQAFDARVQVWPCKSGGICNWKR